MWCVAQPRHPYAAAAAAAATAAHSAPPRPQADSFALLNNKMGGKMDRIRVCGEYFVEVWKATGMNLDRVSFEWSSEVTTRPEYWSMVQDMATRFSVKRISRCCTALGRTEADDMSSAQIMYPLMQGVDPFILGVQIAQLGGDQRKVTMLSREYAGISAVKKARKIRPPVIMHHHMLMGLKEGASKMSKSIPDTAIFMEDTEADVKRKIKKAFCPPGQVADNPVLDLFKWIVFLKYSSVTVQTESGEEREYTTYAELEADYAAGKLHPSHLKPALIAKINEILQPVRDHFASGRPAELLKKVRSYKATR